MLTYEMEMVYRMVLARDEDVTEEEFLQDAFGEHRGVMVSCDDADVIASMEDAVEDRDRCTIQWQGMTIVYDPYEDWDAEEL